MEWIGSALFHGAGEAIHPCLVCFGDVSVLVQFMAEQNRQSLDAAVEETMDQAIHQTRAEIARSQALSQAEADLAQAIEQIAEEHGAPADA